MAAMALLQALDLICLMLQTDAVQSQFCNDS